LIGAATHRLTFTSRHPTVLMYRCSGTSMPLAITVCPQAWALQHARDSSPEQPRCSIDSAPSGPPTSTGDHFCLQQATAGSHLCMDLFIISTSPTYGASYSGPTPSLPRTRTTPPDSDFVLFRISATGWPGSLSLSQGGIFFAGSEQPPPIRQFAFPTEVAASGPSMIARSPADGIGSKTTGTGSSGAPGGEYFSPQQTTSAPRGAHALASLPGLTTARPIFESRGGATPPRQSPP
jgi:hypothetical protein